MAIGTQEMQTIIYESWRVVVGIISGIAQLQQRGEKTNHTPLNVMHGRHAHPLLLRKLDPYKPAIRTRQTSK